MKEAWLRILAAGPLTLVQDRGRWGAQRYGVPPSGAMDARAAAEANALVGNPSDAAVIECTLAGLTLTVEGAPILVSLAGADMGATLDGEPMDVGRSFIARPGQVLALDTARTGLRGYLGVGGGILTPPVLGSRATYVRGGLGGLDGRGLAAGDRLPVGGIDPSIVRPLRLRRQRQFGERPTIRVILGPQDRMFAPSSIHAFLSADWRISALADRMGYRLEGPQLEFATAPDLISEPVAAGAVQVPAGGQPILLMADRQTTGGYPKIAAVISVDLPVVAQLRPGQRLRFTPVGLAHAHSLLRLEAAEPIGVEPA